jgi:hypothetical protein
MLHTVFREVGANLINRLSLKSSTAIKVDFDGWDAADAALSLPIAMRYLMYPRVVKNLHKPSLTSP